MRLFIFVLCFFCFTFSSFAYNIEPYAAGTVAQGENTFNLIFCPLHYQNKEIFLKDTDILIQRLKQTKPFDEFNKLRFWVIDLSAEEQAVIFQPNSGMPPLKVRNDFLEGIALKAGPEYKLVLIDAKGSSSCAELSSIDKMSLIILGKARYKESRSFSKGFLHELGHSLGLRDECIDCAQLSPAGQPNCAPNRQLAEKWWGDLTGKASRVNYIAGCCGNRGYIRPTIASLMNDADKAEDFGPVNERYLRQELRRGF